MNEITDSNSNELDLVPTTSTTNNSRKTDIIADANIALTRLDALIPDLYKSKVKPLVQNFLEVLLFGTLLSVTAGIIAVFTSPDFAYFRETYPNTIQIFIYTIPVVVTGIFSFVIYYFYQRTRRNQFIEQARVFRGRIKELLHELEVEK